MTDEIFTKIDPLLQAAFEDRNATQQKLAPFMLEEALDWINLGGLSTESAGLTKIFGTKRTLGAVDGPRALGKGSHTLQTRQGWHVTAPFADADPRLLRIGALLESEDEREGELLAEFLVSQARRSDMCPIFICRSTRWLPVLGYLGLAYMVRTDDEADAALFRRAEDRFGLSLILDLQTGKVCWERQHTASIKDD